MCLAVKAFNVPPNSIRKNSGGDGLYCGGDGVIREIELLADAQVSMLSDRRKIAPYGLQGGTEGKKGCAELREKNGKRKKLPAKFTLAAKQGVKIKIETPGGGGFGKK